jgi:hypothetical protein
MGKADRVIVLDREAEATATEAVGPVLAQIRFLICCPICGTGPNNPSQPRTSKSERLGVYRAVRAAGSVPAEAGFFLIPWIVDLLTDDRAEEGLREEARLLELIRQKYGLDEDLWANSDDTPAEYREAM